MSPAPCPQGCGMEPAECADAHCRKRAYGEEFGLHDYAWEGGRLKCDLCGHINTGALEPLPDPSEVQ